MKTSSGGMRKENSMRKVIEFIKLWWRRREERKLFRELQRRCMWASRAFADEAWDEVETDTTWDEWDAFVDGE